MDWLPPTRSKARLLQDPEQGDLRLLTGARPPRRGRWFPLPPARSGRGGAAAAPVKAPFLVAEQLRRDQGRRNRAAVDGHERPRGPGRSPVNGAGDQLLPGAGLAGDQDGRIGARHLAHEHQHPAQRRRRADDLLEHRGLADLVAEGDVLLLELIFELLQLLFRAFAGVDVRERAVPPEDRPLVVPKRNGAGQEPSIGPIRAADPHFLIEGTPRGDGLPPVLHDAFAVLRMDHLRPLPHEGLVLAKTRLREQAAGDEVDGAIRPGGPDEGRDRLENRPKLPLRLSGGLLIRRLHLLHEDPRWTESLLPAAIETRNGSAVGRLRERRSPS